MTIATTIRPNWRASPSRRAARALATRAACRRASSRGTPPRSRPVAQGMRGGVETVAPIPNAPATAAASSGRTPASASAASVSHPSAARSGSGPADRERRVVAAHQATASATMVPASSQGAAARAASRSPRPLPGRTRNSAYTFSNHGVSPVPNSAAPRAAPAQTSAG